jgi:hypothetical protein
MDRMEDDSRLHLLPVGGGREGCPLGATMTEDEEGFFSHVVAERASSRSPRIPFPTGYISRTQSEIQLSIDLERAKQHELQMFHRLVNGIRDRQQQLGSLVIDGRPPRFIENTTAATVRNNLIPFPPVTKLHQLTATPPTKPATLPPLLPCLFQQTNATSTTSAATGPVPAAVQDDWSISGFDGDGDDCCSTSTGADPAALLASSSSPGWNYKNHYHHNNNGRLAFDHRQQVPATTRRSKTATTTTTAAPWGSADYDVDYDDGARGQKDDDPPEEEIFQLDF